MIWMIPMLAVEATEKLVGHGVESQEAPGGLVMQKIPTLATVVLHQDLYPVSQARTQIGDLAPQGRVTYGCVGEVSHDGSVTHSP